jgi:hypothetical protein
MKDSDMVGRDALHKVVVKIGTMQRLMWDKVGEGNCPTNVSCDVNMNF